MVVGAALQASAFSLAHFITGRVITGIGNGLNVRQENQIQTQLILLTISRHRPSPHGSQSAPNPIAVASSS